jgi:hypothetical protein
VVAVAHGQGAINLAGAVEFQREKLFHPSLPRIIDPIEVAQSLRGEKRVEDDRRVFRP